MEERWYDEITGKSYFDEMKDKFFCIHLHKKQKDLLPFGSDPCMFCANPYCPKRVRIYCCEPLDSTQLD